jgi:hypothetical protein
LATLAAAWATGRARFEPGLRAQQLPSKGRASAKQVPKARQDFSRHLRIFQPAAAGRDLASPLIFKNTHKLETSDARDHRD